MMGSRCEPGCLRFDIFQSVGGTGKDLPKGVDAAVDVTQNHVFHFYEVYADKAAVGAHLKTPHFAAWADWKTQVGFPKDRTSLKNQVKFEGKGVDLQLSTHCDHKAWTEDSVALFVTVHVPEGRVEEFLHVARCNAAGCRRDEPECYRRRHAVV